MTLFFGIVTAIIVLAAADEKTVTDAPFVADSKCNHCCEANTEGDEVWTPKNTTCGSSATKEADKACLGICCDGAGSQVAFGKCVDAGIKAVGGFFAMIMAYGVGMVVLACCCSCLCCVAILFGIYKLVAGREKTNVNVTPAAYEPSLYKPLAA